MAATTITAADLELLADPANFCQGHRATTCGACRDEYDPCDGHGETSYCDGTCDGARYEWAEYYRRTHRAYPVADDITMEVRGCGALTGQSYRVTFPGTPEGEAAAVVYITTRQATHAISEVPDALIPDRFEAINDLLYPTCEHDMDAHNCYGPQHFMDAAQERALWS